MVIYFLYVSSFITGALLGMLLALWIRSVILFSDRSKRKADKKVKSSSIPEADPSPETDPPQDAAQNDVGAEPHPQSLKDKIPDKTQTLMEINCIADGVEPEQHLLMQRSRQDDAYNMLKKRIGTSETDPEQ